MSTENIAVIRRVFDAFNDRDWQAWESLHHPDAEWVDPPELPDSGVHRGRDKIRRFFDELLPIGDDWRVEVDSIEAVGANRVLMRGRSLLTGKASRMPLEDPIAQLFEMENGRVRRVWTFRSHDDALAAAGIVD